MLSRRGQSTEDVINLQAHSQMSSLLAPSNYHSRVYSVGAGSECAVTQKVGTYSNRCQFSDSSRLNRER